MSAAGSDELVRPGCIVVFDTETKGRPPMLGLVTDKVGKKKSVYTVRPAVAVASGAPGTVAVALRQVCYVVPGGSGYQDGDLAGFEGDASVDPSLLEEAWEMLLEEAAVETDSDKDVLAGASDPRGMAELLFGAVEPTPQQCYQAFRLLEGREGVLRFKRRRDGYYECRSRCAPVFLFVCVWWCGGGEHQYHRAVPQ